MMRRRKTATQTSPEPAMSIKMLAISLCEPRHMKADGRCSPSRLNKLNFETQDVPVVVKLKRCN